MNFVLIILMMINMTRSGIAPALAIDPVLTQHAEVRAEYLCATMTSRLTDADHAGWMSRKFWNYSDMPYNYYGENIEQAYTAAAYNPWTTEMALWKSPAHYANMVSTNFDHVGIYTDPDCRLTVEEFGGQPGDYDDSSIPEIPSHLNAD